LRAISCAAPGRLLLTEVPRPELADGAVRVGIRHIGICGTDYHIFEGTHPFLEYPRVMGHELAVEVVDAPAASGPSAGDLCVVNPYISCGTCVACRAGKPNCCVTISVLGVHRDGGMTDLVAVPAKNLIAAPGLTADECATVEFLSIGAHAVRRAAVNERDRVLVVGAGPIGLGVILFAGLAGAKVSVFDHDGERTLLACSITGATPLAAGNGHNADSVDGFDVVFDASGNRQAMENGFKYVAHGGRYVLVSVVKGAITFMDPDFHRKEMTLFASRNATSEDFEQVMASIRDGVVPVDRLITHRTSLADAVTNIPVWATQKTGLIKALVEIGD
jgi:2-desacetyl-2-hydroxyethyl bacteriochlorophyllide A dehydrogenase